MRDDRDARGKHSDEKRLVNKGAAGAIELGAGRKELERGVVWAVRWRIALGSVLGNGGAGRGVAGWIGWTWMARTTPSSVGAWREVGREGVRGVVGVAAGCGTKEERSCRKCCAVKRGGSRGSCGVPGEVRREGAKIGQEEEQKQEGKRRKCRNVKCDGREGLNEGTGKVT